MFVVRKLVQKSNTYPY